MERNTGIVSHKDLVKTINKRGDVILNATSTTLEKQLTDLRLGGR